MSVIVDRRLNDRNKSAVNRERFIRRYKEHIRKAVTDIVAERSIKDMERGGEVKIPTKDISEPAFRHGQGGDREYVHTGNRTFEPGDRIPRPDGEGGGGKGNEGGDGDGEDSFSFVLSREEFMNVFFDDLELPRMIRTNIGDIKEYKMVRAGYSRSGSPANLSVARSLRNALGRRIALQAGARRELQALQAQEDEADVIDDAQGEGPEERRQRITELRARIARVPFLDEIDLRFRHRVPHAVPRSQAVMFCLMDVSASMDERKKDMAKRFYTLLYLFLTRKYEHVETVFVRHTDDAEEVDEKAFFHDPKTGGTVVYSALKLMQEIIAARYPPSAWNIYGAQASDGDAFGADPEKSRGLLESELLPLCRHYAYVEVPDENARRASTLSSAYSRIEAKHFAMREVRATTDIYPVFRDLFSQQAGS